jgi:hypothetical protein
VGKVKKCIAGLLMMSIIGLHIPNVAFCTGAERFTQIYNKPVTRHKVMTMSTTENVSEKKVKKGQKKIIKWLLIAAGATLAAGLVSAGGGGGGGGDQVSAASDTGGYNFRW